nr:PREDICTED: uncharacterized protein LOC107076537 [Lepisosteus oculatus]XP_015195815.1 PREDICTED: uncharacterized protein LOC107076537 [Lepisosteus oculatus]
MEEYVDRPGNGEELIKKLREKLENGEMEKLEKDLRHVQLKNSLILNWSTAYMLDSNQELKKFLEGRQVKFPKVILKEFFRVRQNQQDDPSLINSDRFCIPGESVPKAPCGISPGKLSGKCEEETASESAVDVGYQPGEYTRKSPFPEGKSCSTNGLCAVTKAEEQGGINKGTGKISQKKQNNHHRKRSMLEKWGRDQVPHLKESISEEEKMGLIRARISIINFKEHKLCPCLVAKHCLVFEDPETRKRRIIEIGEGEKILMINNTDFVAKFRFKLQFQMGVFGDVCETHVVLPEEKSRTVPYNEVQFKEMLKTFMKYIQGGVLPALAVLKKVQRETDLF